MAATVGVTAFRLAAGLAVAGVVVIGGWLFLESRRPMSLPLPPPVTATNLKHLFTLELKDLQGHSVTLERWRGKALVVNYWATWCAPCREEMPILSRLAERFGTKDIQIVGVAAESAEPVQSFARETAVAYPLLIGGEDAIQPTVAFGNAPKAVPFTIVLDRGGVPRAAVLGRVSERALADLLERL